MTTDKSQVEVLSIPGTSRPNYYYGQLLSVDEFQQEQAYFIDKLRQANRANFGTGIINGLEVSCSGGRITISPGFAVDTAGRLVEITANSSFELPGNSGIWKIYLELVEEKCNPAPGLIDTDIDTENAFEFRNIQEITKIWINQATGKKGEPVSEGAILLGRVKAKNGRYKVRKPK